MLNFLKNHPRVMGAMMFLGIGTTLMVVPMRAWLSPAIVDLEIGLPSPNYAVMGLMLFAVAALALLGFLLGSQRREIAGGSAYSVGGVSLFAGLVLAAMAVFELVVFLLDPIHYLAEERIKLILNILQGLFGLLGGVALVMLGLRLFSEGATRRGMLRLWMLAPVLWAWFRLVNYEMLSSSLVRLEDSFFGVGMFIMEMLFLFKLARYVSGIGKAGVGSMMAYSLGTAIFCISGPLVRLIFYIANDSVAFDTSLATGTDFGLGLLAMAVAMALSVSPVHQSEDVGLADGFSTDGDSLIAFTEEDEDEDEE